MGISERPQRQRPQLTRHSRSIVRGAALLALCAIVACSPVRSEGTVQVFAASSLTDAFAAMAEAFEIAEPDIDIELVLGGSSSLREQILDGAQADVFASANVAVMADLVDAGAIKSAPDLFAVNSLALAVPAGNPAGILSLGQLADDELLLGLCAREVPCGAAAEQLFASAGIEPVPDTQEPNVRALLAKIEEGELDVGLVYRSDIASSDVEELPLDGELLADINYAIALVAGPSQTRSYAEADTFVAFVLSSEGQEILRQHGFGVASDR